MMIRVEELRKGILIIDYTYNIREVTGEDIQQQCWHEEGQSGTAEAPLNPIPLSPEWLERCGFEYENYAYINGYLSLGKNFYRDASGDCDGFYLKVHLNDKKVSCVIRYLHQLQNLFFALTGEELNVKI